MEGDEEPDNCYPGTKQVDWQLEQRIRNAVDDTRAEWYVDKLIEKGIKAIDIFALGNDYFIDDDWDAFYLKHIGKTTAELHDNGTYEEILKAKIIQRIADDFCDENTIIEWLNCEQCPDELLQKARAEAMGVKK
ncbi:hypothetical protein R83H12_02824 [Fibrobacteria bacterium R8-3-H12]